MKAASRGSGSHATPPGDARQRRRRYPKVDSDSGGGGGGGRGQERPRVQTRLLLGSLLVSCLTAFAIGRVARLQLIDKPQQEFLERFHQELHLVHRPIAACSSSNTTMILPDPVMKDGKVVPQTTYFAKHFNTGRAATTHSRWIVSEAGQERCIDPQGHDGSIPNGPKGLSSNSDDIHSDGRTGQNHKEAESHLPTGQHLLIDIENVDSSFLNSEQLLANAMLELVKECGLTLLSYHCHKLQPQGVSCAGVLLESHVSFHTWPKDGVITLDLFTCGPNSLLPIVPLAERLFAIPSKQNRQHDDDDENNRGTPPKMPHMVWAHKFRGFDVGVDNEEMVDMFHFPVGQMSDYKKKIISAETDFQRMDVYDVLRPGRQSLDLYKESLAVHIDSYESRHPELFEPDRVVFLDGVMQSRRSGDAPYHEALVHPALFAHKEPRRVAIIGGGEGATLREVLKHNTVEKVVMIDIDEQMVTLSRKYLPFWSDCSAIANSSASCFDDPRVETYFLDAFKWFIDRFAGGENTLLEEPFDVIIMDALDPQIQKEIVNALYDGGPFVRSLPNALSKSGILIAQVGMAPTISFPAQEYSIDRNRKKFIQTLVALGLASIIDYQESHGGFEKPWQYIVAFMDFDSRAEWFANSALVDVKIRKRGMPKTDGASPFRYFDGTTMQSYHFPSKGNEIVFCHDRPDAKACVDGHGFDPERLNVPLTSLEVKPSSLGEKAGRGVFAKVDIPRNSYVGLEKLIPAIYMSPHTTELMIGWERIEEVYTYFGGEELEIFSHGYGHYFSHHGEIEIFVDSTFQCFINHGCHGSNNVGHNLTINEASADPEIFPDELRDRDLGLEAVYNPAKERQVHFYSSAIPLRDIKAGEELFDNYLGMTGLRTGSWEEDVVGLKHQCSGGAGFVTVYDALSSGDASAKTEFLLLALE